MAQASRVGHEPDMAMIHEFIRVHGRRPEAGELERFLETRTRLTLPLPTRVRLGAARMVVRL